MRMHRHDVSQWLVAIYGDVGYIGWYKAAKLDISYWAYSKIELRNVDYQVGVF